MRLPDMTEEQLREKRAEIEARQAVALPWSDPNSDPGQAMRDAWDLSYIYWRLQFYG